MDDGAVSLEEQVLPPPVPMRVYRIGAMACTATLLAALLGAFTGENGPSALSTVRLILVAVGTVAAGSAVSMRSKLPLAWGLAGTAFLFAIFGLPAHWDSARIVATVGCGVGVAGAVIAALGQTLRYYVLSFMACWHFGGIFCATTWPDPAPWTTQYVGTNVYLPYLMFMYLRNAYHFYSPDPGPASLIFALVKYDKIDPATGKPQGAWISLPNRATDYKDPLGLTYYRRLSITEQVTGSMPQLSFSFETPDVVHRRQLAATPLGWRPESEQIPLLSIDNEQPAAQYRVPRPDITRYLLPSYANHILKSESTPDLKAVSVKFYRLEHRVTPAQQLVRKEMPLHPHHPTTFRPYYLGEFSRNADTGKPELIDPQDPLLYWMVPITYKAPRPGGDPTKDFVDYMSIHAGYVFDWSRRQP